MKINLLPLILSSVAIAIFTSCSGPDWNRVKSASTVSIIGYSDNRILVTFNETGSNVGIDAAIHSPGKNIVNKHIESFKFLTLPIYQKALRSVGFSVVQLPLKSDINLNQTPSLDDYTGKHSIDVGINIIHLFGFIDHSTNKTIKKQLAVKTVVQFADDDGFIGSKIYFTPASQIRPFRENHSRFPKQDYKSIERTLVKKIKTDLQIIKGIQKKTHKK